MKTIFKRKRGGLALAAAAIVSLSGFQALGQDKNMEHVNVPEHGDFTEIYRDTTLYVAPTNVLVTRELVEEGTIIKNNFKRNWFVFGTVGVHSYIGDDSGLGKFSGTLSPDFTIGVGKWFTPGVGFKVEFERSNSRGYTEAEDNPYGAGHPVFHPDGSFWYQRMKTNWWDISVSGILNLSRLIMGYEGVDNNKLMNQFLVSLGFGIVHHMGDAGGKRNTDNELNARAELQYSRFFTPAKAWSLDFKVRGLFYQTNHDLNYGYGAFHSNKVDVNLGIAIGATWYLGTKKTRGWSTAVSTIYQTDYQERDVLVIREKETEAVAGNREIGTMTFYVFYPNNYSGRNDAPIVAESNVNTLDYIAGGLFTQKQYMDTQDATERLQAGKSLNGLATLDIPTELAESITFADYLPRGYEMSNSTPLSLSLAPADMTAFEEKEGFYYAPIYDGKHVWQYRIDDATLGQSLLSDANYAETQTFGLNAHSGLDIIRENMNIDTNDELVSFADVYAALNGNEGYISQFTDPETVERIKSILDNGQITLVLTEGMATSQDNYTGDNSTNVGIERNNALSENRATSVQKWLQGNSNLKDALYKSYFTNGNNTINPVDDDSTRGLNAKLNRGVKVKIHYVK